MSTNLWPDFQISDTTKSPKSIVERLGSALKDKTNDLVRFFTLSTKIEDEKVQTTFSLFSPNLSYHYPFMIIRFPVDSFYPVSLAANNMPAVKANDEEELKKALADIFSAPSTIETVQRLMTLANNG